MSRVARGLGLALVAVPLTLAGCRGDRSTRPGDVAGVSRSAAWAKPASSPFVRSLPKRPALELRMPGEPSGLTPSRSLSAAAPGDSTSDICQPNEWCGIQGGIVGGLVGVECIEGPGWCGDAAYSWSIRNAPPNSTTTFTPNPQAIDEALEMLIQTTDSTPPGLYQSVLVITPVGNSPPSQPDTLPITVHVLCNYRLERCPELEIVDLVKDSVVSAPKPRQDTFIGRPMKLRVRHKSGTGTGQYTLVDGMWTLYGQVVKSYDISTGVLTPLTAPDANNSISYYYVVSNNTSEYPIQVEAVLQRSDGALSSPRTSARYRASGPTSVSMNESFAAPQGVTVGIYDAFARIALSFGNSLSPGMNFRFRAAAPLGDNGYLAATQLVSTDWEAVPNPANPPTSVPPPSTNGAYLLDQCSLYAAPSRPLVFVPGAGGLYQWNSDDSPGWILTDQWNAVSRFDQFKTYMMYRPSGRDAIWVPLGKLEWFWTGTTTRTEGANASNGGWSQPTDPDWTRTPRGAPSTEFPRWGQVRQPSPACPPLPTE